jgi:transposase-like protein
MATEEKILMEDTRGRVRVPAERREALLDEFEHSGLSAAAFARLAGVKYPTFALWVQKRRKTRQAQTPQELPQSPRKAAFLQAVIEERAGMNFGPAASLRIELPGGARLLVDSPLQLQYAAELLKLLASGSTQRC